MCFSEEYCFSVKYFKQNGEMPVFSRNRFGTQPIASFEWNLLSFQSFLFAVSERLCIPE